MNNFVLSISNVDGSMREICSGTLSGEKIIESIIGDDFGPPPVYMTISVTTGSGKEVEIHIPYDNNNDATAFVDGELI